MNSGRPIGYLAVLRPCSLTLRAALLAHESVGASSATGIALVSAGIPSLAPQGKDIRADYLPSAFTTGVLIARYTVVAGSVCDWQGTA